MTRLKKSLMIVMIRYYANMYLWSALKNMCKHYLYITYVSLMCLSRLYAADSAFPFDLGSYDFAPYVHPFSDENSSENEGNDSSLLIDETALTCGESFSLVFEEIPALSDTIPSSHFVPTHPIDEIASESDSLFNLPESDLRLLFSSTQQTLNITEMRHELLNTPESIFSSTSTTTSPTRTKQPENTGSSTRDKAKSHQCPHQGCSFTALTRQSIKHHEQSHGIKATHFCNQKNCQFKSTIRTALDKHLSECHPTVIPEKPFKCDHPYCNYAATTITDLPKHMKTHNDNATHCNRPNCRFRSTIEATLIKHILTHHPTTIMPERPYKCGHPFCYYAAKSKKDLLSHKETHADYAIPCTQPDCLFKSTKKEALANHMKEDHLDVIADDNIYKCDHRGCDFVADQAYVILDHMHEHGVSETFCGRQDCQFKSVSEQALTKHALKYHPEILPIPEMTFKRRRTNRS